MNDNQHGAHDGEVRHRWQFIEEAITQGNARTELVYIAEVVVVVVPFRWLYW